MTHIKAFFRDRLVWFVIGGIVLFVFNAWQAREDNMMIMIDLPLMEKLAVQWEAQTKRQATPQELDMLVEAHIREEILMREAMRLGLDENDIIIRRRLAQKMEFLLFDETEGKTPREDELRAFFDANKARFAVPMRVSFRHIYMGDNENAAQLQQKLAQGEDWRTLGHAFMLQREYGERTINDITQIFGSDFADYLISRPQEEASTSWQGPARSAYGLHLVQIITVTPRQDLTFEQAALAVAKLWAEEQQSQARDKAWQDVRARYKIKLAPLPETPTP